MDEPSDNIQVQPTPLDIAAIDVSEEGVTVMPSPTRRARGLGLTHDGRLRAGRLAGLSMGAAIWTVSWPVLAESFLNSCVGLTDTYLSAQLSVEATDAIGGAAYIMWFVGIIAMAISVGATALVSRAVGAGRLAVAHAAVGQSMLLALAFGVLFGIAEWLIAAPVSRILNLTGPGADAFVTYLRIVAVCVPPTTILAAGIACARGAGDSFRPMLAMIVVNIVNIAASWALSGVDLKHTTFVDGVPVERVFLANPFPWDLGIAGIAWGTVIGQSIGAVLIVAWLVRGSSGVQLRRRRLSPHWHTLKRLLRVGSPNFLETFGLWVGNFLVLLMVGYLAASGHGEAGSGFIGAHMVAVRIESFSFLPGFAMGVAAATLAGQYLGAGSPVSARRAVLRCVFITVVVMGLMGLAFTLVPRQIVGLISSQPEHLRLCPDLVMIAGFVQVPFGVAIVFRSALRGAGDVKAAMWITWILTYAVRLPLVYAMSGVAIPIGGGKVLANPFISTPSLALLWAAMCIEIVARGVIFTAWFLRGAWMKARV